MGPGLALLAFGQEAAVPVALIFCFENILHFAIAPMMMALSGDEKSSPAALLSRGGAQDRAASLHHRHGGRRRRRLSAVPPPMPVERLLDYLSSAAAPCALFAMGVTLALRPLKRVPSELLPIAMLKLILHPLICYVVLSWIGNFSETWIFSAVLLAALPTATNVFVIAQQYDVWVERASASVLLTTCMSIATVTGLLCADQERNATAGPVPVDRRTSTAKPLPGCRPSRMNNARSGAKPPSTPRPALRAICAGSMSDSSDMLSRLTAPVRARMSGRRLRS